MTVPPTPPEEKQQFEYLTSSSTEDLNSPAGKSSAQEMFEAARQARNQMGSPQSYLSRGSEKSSSLQQRARYTPVVSPSGRTEQSVTNISVGTQSRMAPSAYGQPQQPSMSQYSPVSNRGRKGSKLKQEVLPSPETTPTLDLFPYTRARLNDVPYKPVRPGDEANLSTDSLRRQMLEVVFGWEEDAPELVRDELSRHPPASQNAILLAKWLNDDPEQMPNVLGSSAMSSQLDWMMLALSGMANHAASKKMGLNFVEKKLREGDIHAAAVILLTLGDRNDAIEVYLEANYYLEAVLLTCLLMPNDWDRLKYLVRKWGEYVVDKSQQYLAIRCFSCTDVEPAGEWTSPTAQMAATANPETIDFSQQSSQMHSDMHSDMQRRNFFTAPTPIAMMKPQTPMTLNPQQQQAQRGPLRLITSFGAEEHHILKFPGLKSDDRTPTVGHGVTPIAESAINDSALTPGGAGSYRLNNMRSINSALLSGRTATPGSFHRQRLPSIGETPIDSNPPQFPLATTPVNVPRSLPTPADSGSEKEKEKAQEKVIKLTTDEVPPIKEEKPTLTLSSARYEPSETPAKETPLTALAPSTAVKFSRTHDLNDLETTVPPPLGFEEKKSRSRGGSRSRKPDGLSIQMIPVHERERSDRSETTGDSPAYRSLHRSNTLNSTTTTQFDSHSEMTSPPTTGNSYYDVAPTTGSSFRSMTKSPGVTGRSIDQYISSLEQAQYYTKGSRSRTNGSQDGADRTPRKKSKTRDREDDRGRNERRAIPSSKRSPSSPVPMSPDDLSLYTAPSIESFDSIFEGEKQMEAENHRFREEKKSRANKPRSESRHEERQRNRSRSRHGEGRGKPASGHVSRRTTPEPFADPYARGRSISKLDGPTSRSPSSPLPMTSSMEDLRTPIEGALRLVSRNRERRDRSGSRRADRGTSSRREVSPDRRKRDGRSGSRKMSGDAPTDLPLSRRGSVSTRGERHRRRAPSIEQSGRLDRETLNSTLSPSMYDSSVYSSIAPEDSISQVSTVNPEYRAQSNPQFLDRRKKELAAAELEARRLSLARRPSAPSIPFPGQHNLHGKSASVDATPTLARSKTDFVPTLANINSFHDRIEARNSPRPAGSDSGSSGRGSNGPRRQGTPRAMRHPMQDSSIPDIPEGMATLLGSGSYRPTRATDPIPRSISAPPEKDESIRVPPSDLPKHPAFDMRIPNSRSSSKADENRRAMSRDRGRAMSRERGISKERKPYPRDENLPPPILPELQHLAMPPPPPPPPIHPGDFSQSLKLQTAFSPPVNSYTPSTVPLPQSEPPSASTHRRGRSGAESTGMFNGLRNLADRMRSTSRGRDTRSPPTEDTVSPYESIPLPPNFHQRVAAQTRSPVIPEEGLGTVAMSPPYESIPDGPPPMRGVGTMI